MSEFLNGFSQAAGIFSRFQQVTNQTDATRANIKNANARETRLAGAYKKAGQQTQYNSDQVTLSDYMAQYDLAKQDDDRDAMGAALQKIGQFSATTRDPDASKAGQQAILDSHVDDAVSGLDEMQKDIDESGGELSAEQWMVDNELPQQIDAAFSQSPLLGDDYVANKGAHRTVDGAKVVSGGNGEPQIVNAINNQETQSTDAETADGSKASEGGQIVGRSAEGMFNDAWEQLAKKARSQGLVVPPNPWTANKVAARKKAAAAEAKVNASFVWTQSGGSVAQKPPQRAVPPQPAPEPEQAPELVPELVPEPAPQGRDPDVPFASDYITEPVAPQRDLSKTEIAGKSVRAGVDALANIPKGAIATVAGTGYLAANSIAEASEAVSGTAKEFYAGFTNDYSDPEDVPAEPPPPKEQAAVKDKLKAARLRVSQKAGSGQTLPPLTRKAADSVVREMSRPSNAGTQWTKGDLELMYAASAAGLSDELMVKLISGKSRADASSKPTTLAYGPYSLFINGDGSIGGMTLADPNKATEDGLDNDKKTLDLNEAVVASLVGEEVGNDPKRAKIRAQALMAGVNQLVTNSLSELTSSGVNPVDAEASLPSRSIIYSMAYKLLKQNNKAKSLGWWDKMTASAAESTVASSMAGELAKVLPAYLGRAEEVEAIYKDLQNDDYFKDKAPDEVRMEIFKHITLTPGG